MPSSLAGRRIVLGVSGGISAYKSVEVCRRLVDVGAHVVPVLTDAATRFVGEVTFSALASEPVQRSMWHEADPIPHTTLGRSADLVIVCPATAHLIATYTSGLADDLLSATLLATRAPVLVCPAMHTEMWEHPATQQNIQTLVTRGVVVVPPEVGRLAGGDEGAGRLAEPATVVASAESVLVPDDLAGVCVLVTAGGTREPIDPVRYLGNRSSGKQGHALADEAVSRGAKVTLVTTVDLPVAPAVDTVRVETAAEMEEAVSSGAASADVVVMAAAVADFRPVDPAPQKLKKGEGPPDLVLEPTPDIVAGLAATRRSGQTLVGFAAETRDLRANAAAKLSGKGLDLIVANDVSAPGAGFAHDTNEVVILGTGGIDREITRRDKREIARAVVDAVVAHRAGR